MAFDAAIPPSTTRPFGVAAYPDTGFFRHYADPAVVRSDMARIAAQLERERKVYRRLMADDYAGAARHAVRNIKRFRRVLQDGRRHLRFISAQVTA